MWKEMGQILPSGSDLFLDGTRKNIPGGTIKLVLYEYRV